MRKLFGMMGSSNAGEAETARNKLTTLLAEHQLTWNDLPEILAATETSRDTGTRFSNTSTTNSASSAPTSIPSVDVLDLVLRLIEEHVGLTEDERMAVALWVLHTYVFKLYTITPRLVLTSPVRGCGKTTLLVLMELLIGEPFRTDSVTPAVIYHQLQQRPGTTLLVDEGDNLGLLYSNNVLRAVFNSGHRKGRGVSRFVAGWPRTFPTFAPLAVAAIGMLPLPLMHRAVLIKMQRRPPDAPRLRLLNETDPAFSLARQEIKRWAATCPLAPEPEMPPALLNRAADNWRPLLAIADDLGHGERARSAAIALCSGRLDEDAAIVLLQDIYNVFHALGTDRISSKALVGALLGLPDGMWNEWRGINDNRLARKLNQSELARVLRPFDIRPHSIRQGDQTARGYYKRDFEAAWRAYCPADTPTHPSEIIRLVR
jgi:hypothetical protein